MIALVDIAAKNFMLRISAPLIVSVSAQFCTVHSLFCKEIFKCSIALYSQTPKYLMNIVFCEFFRRQKIPYVKK